MQDDNSPVSIFSYTGSNAQDARLAAARNGAKRLRVVRFPFLCVLAVRSLVGGELPVYLEALVSMDFGFGRCVIPMC